MLMASPGCGSREGSARSETGIMETASGWEEVLRGAGSGEGLGRDRVTFPDAARGNQSFPGPLKLEVEESAEDMSPRNMWQVYALGGFMILRWAWARWKARRSPDDSSV